MDSAKTETNIDLNYCFHFKCVDGYVKRNHDMQHLYFRTGMAYISQYIHTQSGNKYHLKEKSHLRDRTEPTVFVPKLLNLHDTMLAWSIFGVLVSVRTGMAYISQ